ncbi:phosphoribosylglycinamide formyltransferase [Agaribacter flavus]|uniref:Phosphoribosylglycinamide formyltransferase n=1 Tax=Agaribacter flavus TaxID=1902781 RepID=A0ABV7FNA2_9ALTE
MPAKNIVILVSGNGTNAQAIIESCHQSKINAKVCAVISNRPSAYALNRAKAANIDAICIDHELFESREAFDETLRKQIDEYQPDLVVLAGFMRILSSQFVKHYEGKMLNIHPSLLPLYPGLNTHKRAIENKDTIHGASVHFVTGELDGGPVVIQAQVNIAKDDTPDTLATKVAEKEWEIYPLAIAWYCDGRLTTAKDKLILDGKTLSRNGILYNEHLV